MLHAFGLLAVRVGEASHPGPDAGPATDAWAEYLARKHSGGAPERPAPSKPLSKHGKTVPSTVRSRTPWTELSVDVNLFETALPRLSPDDFTEGSTGIVLLTRDLFAKVSKVRSSQALVAVLPGTSNEDLVLLGLQPSAFTVSWLVFWDDALDRWQRKHVTIVQLGAVSCCPKGLDSETAWDVPESVELTAILSKRLFSSDAEWTTFIADSRSTVPQFILALHDSLTTNSVSFYSWVKIDDSTQRVSFRVPKTQRDCVLSASGSKMPFVVQELCRDLASRQDRDQRTAVLWLGKRRHADALVLLKRLSSHLGLALSSQSFGIRVAVGDLSLARSTLLPSDPKFGSSNRQIRGNLKFEISGLPVGCTKSQIVERFAAWTNAAGEGWHVIPLQTWVSANQCFWVVCADSSPPSHIYPMKNAHVLVQKLPPRDVTAASAPLRAKSPRPARQRPVPPPPDVPTASKAPAPVHDPRIDALEKRMDSLELRSASIESDVKAGFAAVMERLDRSMPATRRPADGPTGQTPPSKISKASQGQVSQSSAPEPSS